MSNLNSGGLSRVLSYIKNWVSGLLSNKSDTNHSHAWNDIASKPSFANVATSGSYNDLSNKPTIPTVNNATLTIQKNGTTVNSFTANASSNVTANISVPTKTSDLTNDSGYLSGTVGIASGGTGATTSTRAIANLTNDNLGTSAEYFLTITTGWNRVGYSHVADAKSVLGVPTKTSQLTNDSGFLSAATSIKVTRGKSISTSGSGYWAAMCNSTAEGSPTLPTANAWWHVLSMDWSGNDTDVTNWCSQLALPTQDGSCLYWRKNDAGGTSINSSTWHKVIDDTNIGSQSVNYANSAGYAGSASSATYAGYVQGDKSTGLYVNSVKYGNALVTTNQSNFGTIFNAPTKNYRIGCATWPNNDDTLIFYSVTNTNVSSSTNSTNQIMTWNAGDGTLSTNNVQANNFYCGGYRIYVG